MNPSLLARRLGVLRSPFHWLAALVLVLHVGCGGGGGGGGGGGETPPPPPTQHAPNIIFILTDDLDDAATATMAQVKTLLADEGMTLREHYVSLSLCCPSRISGLRGQFAHNTTIFTNAAPDGGFQGVLAKNLEDSTFATWLTDAGYRTALFGKYLNGYPNTAPTSTYIPAGWTEWYSPMAGDPYSNFNYSLNENGTQVDYGSKATDYMTDVLSDKADDFIRRSINQHPDQPFFAYIASYAPHSPATPAPRHADAYPGVTQPKGDSFNEADVSDKPSWNQALPLLTDADIAHIDKLYRLRLQSLLAVDEMVARLVNTLRDKGQLDNTYIVFTSDNGYHMGQHRMKPGKTTGFEEDLHVPLIIRGPGIARGSVTNALTANVDYAATFAEIAGAKVPDWVDGRSFLPWLKGQSPSGWRQVLLLEHAPEQPDLSLNLHSILEPPDLFDIERAGQYQAVDITSFVGLRTAQGESYIEYANGDHEFYDRAVDPAQLNNAYSGLADGRKTSFAAWLGSLKTAAGAGLRQSELAAP